MRKQSKAQIIGREGERWFSSILPPEWSLQRPIDDFGSDGIVAVGSEKHLTSFEFGVQVKSTSQLKAVKGKVVAPRVKKDELTYWARKFYPTLLVVYDAKEKVGYYDWISNLWSAEASDSKAKNFYLQVDQQRKFSPASWAVLKSEIEDFHHQFSEAFHAKFEVLPVVATLSMLLRNLCVSTTEDVTNRNGSVRFTSGQAWNHIEVVRQLDMLIPNVKSGSMLERLLGEFRSAYFRRCDTIFFKFSELVEPNHSGWIAMKKPEECSDVLNELTAMLSECVAGLLAMARRNGS